MITSMGTRWQHTAAPRGADYDARWTRLAETGESVHGEADLVDDLLRASGGCRVLDAGCGTGRVAVELARRGYSVVGVDADAGMLDVARAKDPSISRFHADLGDLGATLDSIFDVVLLAGNVMIFLDPGCEGRVLGHVAERLAADGLLVAGFSIRPDRLQLDEYDRPRRRGRTGTSGSLGHVGPCALRRWRVRGVRAPAPVGSLGPVTAMHIGAVSIDCPDAGRLADFYCELLGMHRIVETPDGRVVAVSDGTHTLAMMRVTTTSRRPGRSPGQSQQMHLDLSVSDLDGATAKASAVGARLAGHQPVPDRWWVFLDPAGHTFCLTTVGA